MKHVWAMLTSYHHSRTDGVLPLLKYSRHTTGWKVRVCKRNHTSKKLYGDRYYSLTEMLTGLLTEMLTEILVEIFSKHLQHTMMCTAICTMMYITICSTACSKVHARPYPAVMYHHVNGIFVKKMNQLSNSDTVNVNTCMLTFWQNQHNENQSYQLGMICKMYHVV